jgi:exoribonuclease-2
MQDIVRPDLFAIADRAMERYGFTPGFSDSVIRQVHAIREDISPEDTVDLRDLLWSSIDNFDSMDLDQIGYCTKGTDGTIHVLVAIADVDHYVIQGSPVDRHAAKHGTSIYTGIVTYPMLPDRLSADISSLLPEKDRMAVVIEYTVLLDGTTRSGGVYRAIVRNKAKLIYEEIGDWLLGIAPPPEPVRSNPDLMEQLLLQHDAAERMKENRAEQGVLDLETIEATPVMKDGTVVGLFVSEDNPAHSLIEEFMIAANRTVVAFLAERSSSVIQRIVRTPRNWEGIVSEAAARHMKLPQQPDAKALAKFLLAQKRSNPESFPDLSLTIVKLIGPGEYIAVGPNEESVGHFALAVTDYTHGTAPNRRYVDLIIQRLVKAIIKKSPAPYSFDELNGLAAHLSATEKASKKVERFMRKVAAAVLLQDRIGEIFEGLVTGAADKGTYVRIIDPPVEGRVMKNEGGLKIGRKVRVRLLKTDPENGFIDFERI